jgi:DNA helicase-2/ATP-dependent DNA helicase PcrA
LTANPADNEAFLRAVSVPRRGLGETSLAILDRYARQWGKPLLETARIADRIPDLRPNVREAFRAFAGIIDDARGLEQLPPADLLEHIIRAINYENVLLAEGLEGADRWENVRELVASAANWSEEVPTDDEEGGTPLERFLAEAALLSSADTVVGEEQGVTLMTLHTAKGLEWPVVVLTGMEHGLFPLARAEEQASGLEEERRLCYVGLTRAKDKLYLTWARARRRGGELRPGIASRFLKAIPPGIVEERRTTSLWAPDWSGGTAGRRYGGRSDWSDGTPGASDVPSYRRTAVPPSEEASQDTPRYVKGERVRHRRFGSGTIQGLIGTGRDLKVSVAFDDEEVGVKQLLVAYAGLEREWESA